MEYKRFGSKILVRIDKDEEILEKVKELALKEKIRLAAVQALGATNSFTVGVYNVAEKKYYANTFSGSFEIVSLTGTINTMNGEFYTHLHMSAGNDKGEVFGGHLNRAVVSATCEMVVDVLDGTVDRAYDPVTGLNLFKFPSVKENDCAESVLKESRGKRYSPTSCAAGAGIADPCRDPPGYFYLRHHQIHCRPAGRAFEAGG